MALGIGIVGLPNVGKSTLFNALTRAQNAAAENYPFCTIEPNKATVPVPDARLEKLAAIVHPQRIVNATVDFVDIAGLVRGASRGEGLGNKFLANIRESNAILHVVRCFQDDNIVHVEGGVDPVRDAEIIETELLLADLETLEGRVDRLTRVARSDKDARAALDVVEALKKHVEEGHSARTFPAHDDEHLQATLRELPLLTDKPVIFVANVGEDDASADNDAVRALRDYAAKEGAEVVRISARMEEDLAGLSDAERQEFLASYGVSEGSLDQVVQAGYRTLGLASFLTAGPLEARAWTFRRGWKAPRCAGVIHTDFEKGFIRAQVISYDDYVRLGGEAACKAAGLVRMEGKEYEMQDGDVVEFLFN